MEKREVDLFEKIYGQMEALHTEISALSKKSPNDAVNKFKLKFINRVIEEANGLLKEEYKPFTDFDFFGEDDVPTNSDVSMIIAQYLNCLEKLRSDNIGIYHGSWCWVIDGRQTDIRTSYPKKLER